MFNVIVSKRYSQGKEVFDKTIRQNKIFFRPVKSGRFKGVGSSYKPTDIRHKAPYDNRSRRRKAYGRDTVPAVHRKQSDFGNDVPSHIYTTRQRPMRYGKRPTASPKNTRASASFRRESFFARSLPPMKEAAKEAARGIIKPPVKTYLQTGDKAHQAVTASPPLRKTAFTTAAASPLTVRRALLTAT